MKTLVPIKEPDTRDLDGLESLLDLVFCAGALPEKTASFSPAGPARTGEELLARLKSTCAELEATRSRLEAASFRLGYMEALLCSKDAEIKRLAGRLGEEPR